MAELLKKMSEINAVSGNENDIRNLIIAEIKDNVTILPLIQWVMLLHIKKAVTAVKKSRLRLIWTNPVLS